MIAFPTVPMVPRSPIANMEGIMRTTCAHSGSWLRPRPFTQVMNMSPVVVSFAVEACCKSPAACPSEKEPPNAERALDQKPSPQTVNKVVHRLDFGKLNGVVPLEVSCPPKQPCLLLDGKRSKDI